MVSFNAIAITANCPDNKLVKSCANVYICIHESTLQFTSCARVTHATHKNDNSFPCFVCIKYSYMCASMGLM